MKRPDQVGRQATAVVPVKQLALAKSRLALPPDERLALALAFAVDTVSALCSSPLIAGVLVVTSDPVVVRRMGPLGVRVVPDGGAGLGPAVREGLRVAAAWRPRTGLAVVPADLPCLRADDVARVLTQAPADRGAFVPDRSTTGTTLVVCPPGRSATASYGPGSAARHRALGLHPLLDAPVRARHDVDTLDDVHEALLLGTGPATSALAEDLVSRVGPAGG